MLRIPSRHKDPSGCFFGRKMFSSFFWHHQAVFYKKIIHFFDKVFRGISGKSGKELEWVKLVDIETDQLQAILRNESWHLTVEYDQAIRRILRSRGVEPLPYSQCRIHLAMPKGALRAGSFSVRML